jgi:homoserine O-acetyltransferase
LDHHANKLARRFDANTYILITRMLDYFDLAREYGDDPVTAFRQARAAFLVLSFSSDWRFPPERSREIANALIGARKAVSYADIEASQGHDAFLMPIPRYLDVMRAYLRRVADECRHA